MPDAENRAAVDAREHPLIAKFVQILADCLRGHFEAAGEILDRHAPGLAREIDNRLLSRDEHGLRSALGAKMKRKRLEDKSREAGNEKASVPERIFG